MSNGRIIGKNESISYQSVEAFFEQRGASNLQHKYNYVLYLDNQPEVAILRDRQSKEKIESLLDVQAGMTVLDLGCGIGRWGEFFCRKGAVYYGVDGSEKMIERAEENLSAYDNKVLKVGNLQETDKLLRSVTSTEHTGFDIIFMSGVLMYLNDDDVAAILRILPGLLKTGGHICMIESMAEGERLTLKDIYSEELKQNYSAIYRTDREFRALMSEAFGDGLVLKLDELMDFSDGLQKKREHVTLEHCVIWEAV